MGGGKDGNEAADKEGRWRCACIYNCGGRLKRGRRVVFPELMNDEEVSWRM